MLQWRTGFLLLAILLPVWAGDSCNVVRLREYFQLIDILNKTIQEQMEECKNTTKVLKKTIQEQREECKNTTEVLNGTIQEQASKINQNEADIGSLKQRTNAGERLCQVIDKTEL